MVHVPKRKQVKAIAWPVTNASDRNKKWAAWFNAEIDRDNKLKREKGNYALVCNVAC